MPRMVPPLGFNIIIIIRRGHWAHPWTRLEGVRGDPHLGTRESVLGRMRWLLRHSKRVQEGLSNTNNYEPDFQRYKIKREKNEINFSSDNSETYNAPFTLKN